MKKDLIKLASFLKESGNIKEYNRLLGLIKESKSPFELFVDVAGSGLEMAGGWLTGSGDDKKEKTNCLHIAENFSSRIGLSLSDDQKESLNNCEELEHPQQVKFSDITLMLKEYSEDKMKKAIEAYNNSVTFYVKFVPAYNVTIVDTEYSKFNIPVSNDFTAITYEAYLTQTGIYNYIYVKMAHSVAGQKIRLEEIERKEKIIKQKEDDLKKKQKILEEEERKNQEKLEKSRQKMDVIKREEDKKDDVFYYTEIDSDTNGVYYIGKDGTKLYLSEKQRKNIKVKEVE